MNAYIEIMRPANGIMAAIAVAVGYVVVAGMSLTTTPGYAMFSAFLILGAGMAINDYYDYAIDIKTKKHRPIPSGRIKKKIAFVYSIVLFLIGIILSYFVNFMTFAIAIVAAVLLFGYAAYFAKKVFSGNLVVAVNTGLTFVFGAAVVGEVFLSEVIALAGMALFATLAREIYKDIQDIAEDKKTRRTLPMEIGKSKSTLIAAFALVTAVMLSPIPYLAGIFGYTYLLLITLVDIGFLYTAYTGSKSGDYGKEAKYCKLLQFGALIAFIIGSI